MDSFEQNDKPKRIFTPTSAPSIKGNFTPVRIRADWDQLTPSDKFLPQGIKGHCIEKMAAETSRILSRLPHEDIEKLDTFAVCLDMHQAIGEDDDPFIAPDSKEGLEADVNARREEGQREELEEYIATRLIATFKRSPIESASDPVPINRIPRFDMIELYPTAQDGYPAFMPVLPQRRDAPEAHHKNTLDTEAGYTATIGEVKLVADALAGDKPSRPFGQTARRRIRVTPPINIAFNAGAGDTHRSRRPHHIPKNKLYKLPELKKQ